ncbi:MAG: hypothetical protein RL326_1981 [Pseudomonadota bacterium]|jgi:hypothetical protein
MRTTKTLLIIASTLVLCCDPASASAPTPTPHADHKVTTPQASKVQAAEATLNAELEKPISRPETNDIVNPPGGQDLGGLNDVGDVGGDFEE